MRERGQWERKQERARERERERAKEIERTWRSVYPNLSVLFLLFCFQMMPMMMVTMTMTMIVTAPPNAVVIISTVMIFKRLISEEREEN